MPKKKTVIEEETVEEVEKIDPEVVEDIPWELKGFLNQALENKYGYMFKLYRMENRKEYHLKNYSNFIPDEDEIYSTFGHAYSVLEFKAYITYWDKTKKKQLNTTRLINIDRDYLHKPLNGNQLQPPVPQQQNGNRDLIEAFKVFAPMITAMFTGNKQSDNTVELLRKLEMKSFDNQLRTQGEMLAWQRELGNTQAGVESTEEDTKELAEIAIDLVLSKIGEWTGLDGIGKKIAARRIKKTDEFVELKNNPAAIKIMCENLDENEKVGPGAVDEFLKHLKMERPT